MSTPVIDDTSPEHTVDFDTATQTIKVLLVEDSSTDAQLVRAALCDLRDRDLYAPIFQIRSAPRLSTAVKCLADETFDVILLDLSLPDTEGFEQSLTRIHERAPNVPIIVLTGLGDEVLGLKMIRNGAQDFLVKSRVERYLLVKSIRYAIERKRSEQAQARLRLKLVSVQEGERHRIARELHDEMGQSLAALILGLKSLAHVYQPNDQANLQFQHLQNIANDLAREVHSLALDLRPTALDDLGLVEALSNYLEVWSARWQISADFHSQGFTGRRLPPHLETTIYRIAQQALTNIARHAHATTASLILEWVDDRVTVIIEDDGCGFDVEAVTKNQEREQRLGLLGMEERVALVRGGLTIESALGRGTSVYVRIPISFQPNGELAQWTN